MTYAAETEVPISQTRQEIERMLESVGATSFGYLAEPGKALIAFQFNGMLVRFVLPLPGLKAYELNASKRLRNQKDQNSAQAKDHRSRWRALGLGIKAKLVFVESGIRTFEQEFLADFVMPNGKTLGDSAIPQLAEAVKSGRMPQLTIGN